MKRNLTTALIAVALVVVMVGATMAWFTDQAEATNTFEAGTVDINVTGAVEMPISTLQNWNPGDTNFIKYTFTNNGTKKLRFRVGFSGAWENEDLTIANVGLVGKDGGILPLDKFDDPIVPGPKVTLFAENTWDFNDDWHFKDGYLYYGGTKGSIINPPDNGILNPGESVELVIEIKLDGPTTGNAYQGLTFDLDGLVQAIQASHADEWDWDNIDFGTGLELN